MSNLRNNLVVNDVGHIADHDAIATFVNGNGSVTPSTQAIGDAATAGTSTVPAAADHKHGLPAFAGTGSAATPARSDHNHSGTYEAGQSVVVYVGGTGANDSNSGLVSSLPLATLAAAVTKIGSGTGLIRLAPGAVTAETAAIAVDAARIKIRGVTSAVTWAAIPGAGYCIRFYTTATSATLDRVVTDGVTFRSNTGTLTGIGVQMGDGTNSFNDFSFVNGGVQGFSQGVNFLNAVWRLHFNVFHVERSGVTVAAGVTNFGEKMTWRDSLFDSLHPAGFTVNLTAGDWLFEGCQFDSSPLVADAGGSLPTNVMLRDCHQENPQGDIYYYLTASHNGRIDVAGGRFLVDDPGVSFGQGVFNSASTNTNAGSGIFVHDDVVTPGSYAHYTAPQAGQSQTIDGGGPGWVCDTSWVVIGATGAPGFTNSFTNAGAPYNPTRYRMREGGVVEIQGAVTGGLGLPSAIFTLPTRYRPANTAGYAINVGGVGGWGNNSIAIKGASDSTPGAIVAFSANTDFGNLLIDVA